MPQPFIIFAIILAVIWTISGLATWANKQKEAERRARLREQLARTAGKPAAPTQAAQRAQIAQREQAAQRAIAARQLVQQQISQGIAQRFPDVLLPPAPQTRRPQVRAQGRPQTRAPRPIAKKAQRQPQSARQMPAPPPLTPVAPPPPPLPEAPPAAKSRSATTVSPRINAAMLSRWMTPATLNQQFLLTEILQPPLAMREQR